MNTPNAKTLITGEQPVHEGDEMGAPAPGGPPPQRGPGGPPRRPGGPPRRPGAPAAGGQGLDPDALKDLIILDLLHALGNDAFYVDVANVALKGQPLSPQMVRHLMDEAPKYADKMSPAVNELMGKIAAMPQQ
jgi:hypothetical protein